MQHSLERATDIERSSRSKTVYSDEITTLFQNFPAEKIIVAFGHHRKGIESLTQDL